MANRAVDLVITYRVIKLLVTPFERQAAFRYGIIDKDGKALSKIEKTFSKGLNFSLYENDIVDFNEFTVLNNEVFDRPEGYDYRAKEKAEADFINKYGTEMYDYAQQFLASGKTLMPYEAEFLNARKQFEYFWEASEKAVIERESDPETAEAILNDFYALTSAQRDEVLKDSPDAAYIKGLINKVSGVKKALRQQNSGLDGFLYRWGYYDTLVHPDNKNYERVWETTGFIAPDVYQNGLRKFKPNI